MTLGVELPDFDSVLAAAERVRRFVRETPVLTHAAIDAAAGARIFVKAECLQLTGSFKIRGATNRLAQLTPQQRKTGVVAFSSGNHAQGVARAARLLGLPAVIVMPSDAPQVKIGGVKADGGEIVLYDRNAESREAISARIAGERGAVVVPSYDDLDIIAGQGTAGLEFARQMDAAQAMGITAPDLMRHKIVDGIVKEPVGGAHRDPQRAMAAAAKALDAALRDLEGLTPVELKRQRRDRFYAIGREGL